MTRLLVSLLVAVAGLLALSESASACSCASVDPREMLGEADAAFVGTLTARRVERPDGVIWSSGDPTTLVFRVETPVKGDLGEEITVKTVSSEVSCGIEARVGERVGLFLEQTSGGWRSSSCLRVDPAVLRSLLDSDSPGEPGGGADARPPTSALETLFSLRSLCALRLMHAVYE